LLGGLLAFLFLLGVWVLAALHLTSAAASPLEFPFNLQSGLEADYQADPLGARIYELRLSIVQGLGAGGGDPQSAPIPDSLKEMMSQPVPSATPRPATSVPSEVSTQASTQLPTQEPTATPAVTSGPTGLPTDNPVASQQPTTTPTTGAAAMAGLLPECSNLSITGVWISNGEQIRASVRNNNQSRAYLTNTLFEWPDVPSPAYVDWMDFNTRYYNDNDYSSPTTAGGTWLSIHSTTTRIWSADFDDEPAEGLYGGFKVILTFEYPGWGSCVVESFTYRVQPPTLTPSLTKTPTLTRTPTPTRTPTKTDTPTGVPTSATWTETPVTPTDVPTSAPSPTDTETPVPTDTETPLPATPG
jgi:hypothetical protein